MPRKSKQKDSILRVVKETSSHPTAEWIYEQVKKEIPNISLGTVYRNLKLLKQTGDISELGAAGTLSRFDGNFQNHYHFRCEQCGHLFDVDEPVDKVIDERVAQKTGFLVSYHCLEFRGLCNDCQRSSSPKGDKID
jgi:Fur family peroxide stress response transcriptional regulator